MTELAPLKFTDYPTANPIGDRFGRHAAASVCAANAEEEQRAERAIECALKRSCLNSARRKPTNRRDCERLT